MQTEAELPEPSNENGRSEKTNKIEIQNLPPHIKNEDIEELVNVTSQNPKKFEHDENAGIMYITFNSPEDAEQCIEHLKDHHFEDGTQIKVDFCKSQRKPNKNNNSNSAYSYRNWPLRIVVPSDYIGAVIGKQGQTITKITIDSRARVDIHRRASYEADTFITIKGSPDSCTEACKGIMTIVHQEARSMNKGDVPFRILCPNHACGRLIGKQGNMIKAFMEKTNTSIVISRELVDSHTGEINRVITITGSTDNCLEALKTVADKIKQCLEQDAAGISQFGAQLTFAGMTGVPHMSRNESHHAMGQPISYLGTTYYPEAFRRPPQVQEQLEVVHLYIPEKSVGAVIGSNGHIIRSIMLMSGARIKILGIDDKNGSGENNPSTYPSIERKAVISGSPENQWKAQFCIFEKLKDEGGLASFDEILLRSEIMVPKHSFGMIVGKGGRNVKEMQRVTGATIHMAMEQQEEDDVPVTIIGHFYATQAAQRRVRSLMCTSLHTPPAPQSTHPGTFSQCKNGGLRQ